MSRRYKLGADPEIFLLYNDDIPKSAINIIKGTKEEPFKITNNGHSVQVDNVLLEFNVPPSSNPHEMNAHIDIIINWFKQNIPKDTKLSIVSSLMFPESELEHEKAKEFGCDPDFDAWQERENDKPTCGDLSLRSAGGHLHISYPNFDMDKSIAIIRASDLFLGVPSVLFDNDVKRRELYGKAGAFRFKRYSNDEGGVEYRTLSNFWIKNQYFVNMIFNQMDKVFEYVDTHTEIDYKSELGKNIVKCINTGDKELAKSIIEDQKVMNLNTITNECNNCRL